MVYSDWGAVADNSRPFVLYCDASRDGFGATIEQEQPEDSIRPIVFDSHATLNNERSWAPLDLEAGSIVWAIERLCGHLLSTNVPIYSDHKALDNMPRLANTTPAFGAGYNSSPTTPTCWNTAKGSSNGNTDFLSRLPHQQPTSTALDPTA